MMKLTWYRGRIKPFLRRKLLNVSLCHQDYPENRYYDLALRFMFLGLDIEWSRKLIKIQARTNKE